MGKDTGIVWAHHTFNLWFGCDEVSSGCDNCYARVLSERFGHHVWGQDARRYYMTDAYWKQPKKWNAAAEQAHERRRVFAMSMGDLFETPPAREYDGMTERRQRLFSTVIPATPWLDWMLLTKRVHNLSMVPADWQAAWPENVWPGVSIENQDMAEVRMPRLLAFLHTVNPAALPPVVFLSIEPQLSLVDLWPWHTDMQALTARGVQWWLIFGGESDAGSKRPARPIELDWLRFGIRQARELGAIPLIKQLGSAQARALKLKNTKGEHPEEWPEELRVQEFPVAVKQPL